MILRFKTLTIYWVIFMFLITFSCLLTYVVMQQALRLGANAAPAQLVRDVEIQLDEGKNPVSLMSANKVDISKSLDTFFFIYDSNKNLVATSATQAGKAASYPKGVLDYVKKKGEDRVTWQTQHGLRFASVAIKAKNGYVVAAHSLYETENLIDHLGRLILMAWVACLICSAIAAIVLHAFMKKLEEFMTVKKA